MFVWTTKEPVTTAASSDRPERSIAAAHNSTVSRSGRITTIGFHGLTSPPSTVSEYVVADGPEAASRNTSQQIHTAAHSVRAGVLR